MKTNSVSPLFFMGSKQNELNQSNIKIEAKKGKILSRNSSDRSKTNGFDRNCVRKKIKAKLRFVVYRRQKNDWNVPELLKFSHYCTVLL